MIKRPACVQLRTSSLLLVLLTGFACLASPAQAAGPSALIAGYDSDNVVQFDLTTGKWTEIARLPEGSQPRGIAVGEAGKRYRVTATIYFLTWDAISEVNNVNGAVDFVDQDADRFDQRFYRLESIGIDK